VAVTQGQGTPPPPIMHTTLIACTDGPTSPQTNKQMGHHYPFFVPWSEFIVSLCKTLNVPVKLEDPGFKSMKALLSAHCHPNCIPLLATVKLTGFLSPFPFFQPRSTRT
jgi:hypothetical protein